MGRRRHFPAACIKKRGNVNSFDTDHLVTMIDEIEAMPEEVFEHYKAKQTLFKDAVRGIITRRQEEGSFAFLTEIQRSQFSYAIKKAGRMGVLLWEKYEALNLEL